jgi:hypothetical protein
MFRLRLHPSRLGLLVGITLIAFWALLWLSVVVQIHRAASEDAQPPAVHAVTLSEL